MNIYPVFPLINTIVCTMIGFFLLMKPQKKIAHYALATGALFHGFMTFFFFLFLKDLPTEINFINLKVSLFFASLTPVSMVLFSFHHVRIDSLLFTSVKKISEPVISAAGILFACLSYHPSFILKVEVISDKWVLVFGPLGAAFTVYLISSFMVLLFQMEQTFRATQALQRHRLDMMILGIASGSIYSLFIASILLLYNAIYFDFLTAGTIIHTICWGMIIFAVIRHRLLEVGVFISRHVIYTSISAFGVGLYLVGMGVLGYLMHILGMRWDLLLAATFISLILIILGALLLSSTLQKKLKRFINRHFYRYKYDYRLEWNEFTQKISEVTDLLSLLLKIIEMISDTLWVNQVSIWLYNDRSGTLTFKVSRNLPRKVEFLYRETLLVRYLLDHQKPLDAKDPDMQHIVEQHQDLFSRMNISLVVPLKIRTHLIGMITLGEEMKGNEYKDEDYELLMTIALQASSAIFSAQLIEEVALVKETESFHKISSFLVHDLKNLVSSLSLVLQNAERNIAKPEFQKDLLSTLVDTVDKMKLLIEKLSTLPKKLEIKKSPVEINELINDALESSKAKSIKGVEIATDLNPLPNAKADGEYIKKVLVNLILNAVQALTGGQGRVEITSYAKNGFVHVEILDSGIGMTEDFIRKKLFKPFTTTKKKGLGIGLYQCKAIMEAHGGSIEVSSIPNRGSQFILNIPLE